MIMEKNKHEMLQDDQLQQATGGVESMYDGLDMGHMVAGGIAAGAGASQRLTIATDELSQICGSGQNTGST